MSSSGEKKRKFHGDQKKPGAKYRNNPRRGGPAMLLTSETSREIKCEREGLDILRYYVEQDAVAEKPSDAKLSLDDEIAMLQQSKREKNSDFRIFDTGCRGTVFVMCVMDNCNLIPSIKADKQQQQQQQQQDQEAKDGDDTAQNEASGDADTVDASTLETKHVSNAAKKQRKSEDEVAPDAEEAVKDKADESIKNDVNDATSRASIPDGSESKSIAASTSSTAAGSTTAAATVLDVPPWDPIETVRTIITDLREKKRGIPCSRFLARMIPVQATCFASAEEIQLTTAALLKRYFPAEAKTFAVTSKRRNCGKTLRSNDIIQAVAGEVMKVKPDCKVKLENPDVTINVEICKTLCGVAVIRNIDQYGNFNLVEAREYSGADGQR